MNRIWSRVYLARPLLNSHTKFFRRTCTTVPLHSQPAVAAKIEERQRETTREERVLLYPNCDFEQVTISHPNDFDIILYNDGETIHGYHNVCPHMGLGLDFGDGNCLNGPNELMCATHGARFEASSGACTKGPCKGKSLSRIHVWKEDGAIYCRSTEPKYIFNKKPYVPQT